MNVETKNNQNFAAASRFLQEHSSFILASHAGTDGDDLGSILAIAQILESANKKVRVVAVGGVPPSLFFLPGQSEVFSEVPEGDFDAIILSGCSQPNRTDSEWIENSKLPLLNIDHHPDNKFYGTVNLVDQKKSSVAELVYDFIKFLKVPITPNIAKCLLTGMSTDTGSFMHPNTSASTLAAAAELLGQGARIDKIHGYTLQNKDLNSLKAWARAMENSRIDEDNHLALSVITEEDQKEIGILPPDAFENFVNYLNTVPEIRFSMFLRQDGEFIKGSIRSIEGKNFDVSKLAKVFGGGGHRLASGFKIKGKISKTPDGKWNIE